MLVGPGRAVSEDSLVIRQNEQVVYQASRSELRTIWAETTHQMQRLRDNPACADEEFALKQDNQQPRFTCAIDV